MGTNPRDHIWHTIFGRLISASLGAQCLSKYSLNSCIAVLAMKNYIWWAGRDSNPQCYLTVIPGYSRIQSKPSLQPAQTYGGKWGIEALSPLGDTTGFKPVCRPFSCTFHLGKSRVLFLILAPAAKALGNTLQLRVACTLEPNQGPVADTSRLLQSIPRGPLSVLQSWQSPF